MKHFDLFSGYGGFAQAGKRAYEDNSKRKHISEKPEQEEREQGGVGTTHEQRKMLRTSDRTTALRDRLGVPNGKKDGRSEEDKKAGNTEREGLESAQGQGTGSQNGRDGQLHDNRTDDGTFTTIGFSEIDQYANKVLAKRFPGVKNYGDITKINWAEVPDFDILTGGSPCQDLSIAGKRAGLDGARSGLFFEYMRAVKEKRPRYFIWENVKGALSSQNGWDFATVINQMAEAGYSLWWQVLNAKDFGIPQNRERVFVVGFRDEPAPQVFLEPGSNGQIIKKVTRTNKNFAVTRGRSTQDWKESEVAPSRRLSDKDDIKIIQEIKVRRITPRECERLMDIPDEWTDVDISDTQRYKLCGNGIVVEVAEQVIRKIILRQL